ncbi:type 2 lanthipeptide synthetase LanM family protein [Natrinema marinum]|uniref:type 2 lanthipeptide synthetase LanM family protein n=1 Tax=Natrinema marinum TaxID=2961598 RepID=UPI0020C8FFFB|nr:type 2 lanthipeptide synthetase LanM family protein [Natrinema marinum]
MSVFTDEERREIAGRARTVAERFDGPPNSAESPPPIDPDEILEEWKQRFPNEESFRRRLARDGLTEAAVRDRISATRWPADEPLPDWIDTLSALVRHVEASAADDRAAVAVPDETPFRELIAAIVDFARERVSDATVPGSAVSPMEAHLVDRLESLCVRALYVEFKSFVEVYDSELASADPAAVSDPPTAYYDRFIAAMLGEGFKNLCLEYPVLARHFVRLLENWRRALEELCRRLQADRDALRRRFGVDGAVTALEPLTDDTHAGGRVPVRVAFESGAVVYKPRPVDGEVAFYAILDRLDDHLETPPFETPSLLSRDGYGWMELCEYRDLPDEAAADRYYERAGALLCLAYVLDFTDCHYENLIATGETPTLVDAETVFHPPLEPAEKPFETEASAVVDRSVLLSVLLPFSVGDPREPHGGRFVDAVAGFGRDSEPTSLPNRSRPTIEAVNTDVMTVEMEPVTADPSTNTPSTGDADRPPAVHADAVIDGFESAYETVRELHEAGEFLTEIADPELIEGVATRLIYRSTGRYASIRRSAAARDPLRDGARLTVEFERLAVPFFDGTIESDRCWPLYAAERRALRSLDVPRFGARADERTIVHRGGRLDVTTGETGYGAVRRRLDAMDRADRRRQTWLIRQGLGEATTAERAPPPAADAPAIRYEREAVDLFEGVVDARIEGADGPGWVSIVPESGINFYPADRSLFWGTGGIALTAAALADATGRERYRRLVDETLAPIADALATEAIAVDHGGLQGIGSVVYVFSAVSDLLEDQRYRDAALAATDAVTARAIRDADALDVVEGVAGTLLGLLACYERYGDAGVLGRAVDCGERLLEARTVVDGHRVWLTTDEDAPLTGFAHGSSGIAYALARLAAATDDDRFAEATREVLAFESALYSPSRRNWPRSAVATDTYHDRWCHGRTGMALGRLAVGELLGDERVVADACDALLETATAPASHLDNLCCGNFGRVEALLSVERHTGRDDRFAAELARRCLARRDRDGVLSLPKHAPEFSNPTFFDGVAGPAYTLLRLRDPEALPCALLLE